MSQSEPQAAGLALPPIERSLRWWAAALRLWRPAPFRWAVACLVPLVVEGLLQLIPDAGMIVSKLVITLVGAGLFEVMDDLARTGRFSWRGLAWGFRASNMGAAFQLAIIMLAGYFAGVLMAWAIYGRAGLDVALLAGNARHPELATNWRFAFTLILPGTVPGILLMLATPLVVLQGVNPWIAAWRSLRWFAGAPLAFLGVLAVSLILVAIALPLFFLILFVAPWLNAMEYAAYLDVFGRDRESAMRATTGNTAHNGG